MDWEKLLSKTRYSRESTMPRESEKDKTNPPSEHEKSNVSVYSEDAERIIYSSPFRRLQGKTQVHPFPASDYLRTRLTHTVEVAHAGRLIAEGCAKQINRDADASALEPSLVGDIVYAACLAHDLGNPPFGHIGEYAIQTWFEHRRNQNGVVKDLLANPKHAGDFLYFDGNAQGFRIITRLSGWRRAGGLQLSYATLGAFSKYPYSSLEASKEKKKFGFMLDDERAAENIYKELGLVKINKNRWCRHPLAHIVEAADDICYLTTDIEDACRTKMLPFTSAEVLLKSIGDMGAHLSRYKSLSNDEEQDRIAYLRAGAVSTLIDAAYGSFCENLKSIMDGTFPGDLLGASTYKTNVNDIREACKSKVYKDTDKLQIETAGYTIIMSLMDIYGGMIEEYCRVGEENLDMRNSGIHQLLPQEFRGRLERGNPYRCFLILIDYISGMTDRYALDLYQKLTASSARLGRMI